MASLAIGSPRRGEEMDLVDLGVVRGAAVPAIEVGEDVDGHHLALGDGELRGAVTRVVRPGVRARGQIDSEVAEDRKRAGRFAVDRDADRGIGRVDAGAAAVDEIDLPVSGGNGSVA